MTLALAVYNEDVQMTSPIIEIVPTTIAHIRELGDTIREGDRREIESYGFSHHKGLWRSFKGGLNNKTALIDGRVAACWGCGGVYMGDKGQPWLLTSYEVYKISPLKFARIYQREVKNMLKLFPRLENYVDAQYDAAVRLLDIVGFTLEEPQALGNGLYRRFWMEKRD